MLRDRRQVLGRGNQTIGKPSCYLRRGLRSLAKRKAASLWLEALSREAFVKGGPARPD